jgi:gliding-associated putative ABC transporter substrate-binding component GldG
MPGTGITYEDSLTKMGVSGITINVQVKEGEENKRVYPVALITYKDQQSLVSLYSGNQRIVTPIELNSAEAVMEYQFAKTLDKLIHPYKPLVAYSRGNGEPDLNSDPRTADLQQSLGNDYQIFTFNLNQQPLIPDTFKVLMMVKPTLKFSEAEKLKMDQFLMRGGRIICFIDNLIAEQDSLQGRRETIAYDRDLNLTDLLFKYGARINTDLVMDLDCDFLPFAVGGTADNPQFEYLHWNYYPLFEPENNHAITRNTGLIAGRFVNSIDTITSPGIKKTILLSSSDNSRMISTPALISVNENRNTPEDAKFKKSHIPVAVLLEGKFTSLFRNRISKEEMDSLNAYGTPFRESATEDNKIILVADGDMVLNDVSPKEGPLPMGRNFYTMNSPYEYAFANRDFLLNCMEYLVNKPGIMETRNKNIVLRLLDSEKVKKQKSKWQLINIALPVIIVLIFGFFYQQIRRRKFA